MPKPVIVSYSELDAYRQCPHKHDLAYKQRWTPQETGPALARGTRWHKVLELHYGHLMSGASDKARLQAITDYLAEVYKVDAEDAELLAWMYDGHVEMWGLDGQWEVLGVEQARLVQLPYPNGRRSPYWLRMRIDLLVAERMGPHTKVWVVDHKSGKDLPKTKQLDIADQFGLYTWGERALGTPVFGQLYSAARTYRHKTGDRPVDERFARYRLYKTDIELQTIATEAMVTARLAYTAKDAPRSPDEDRCGWRCPFTEPCMMGRKSGPEAELHYLASTMQRLTEQEQLEQRGYGPTPATVGGTDG